MLHLPVVFEPSLYFFYAIFKSFTLFVATFVIGLEICTDKSYIALTLTRSNLHRLFFILVVKKNSENTFKEQKFNQKLKLMLLRFHKKIEKQARYREMIK